MRKSIICITILFPLFLAAQQERIKPQSAFFPLQRAEVLVVGTFHFNYPNLDVKKTGDNDKIDVLAEPKQTEVTELVNYIKKFKPNKIAIEAHSKWDADEKLKQYKLGNFRDKRDERFQIAIRLAAELGHQTIYSIDATSLDADLQKIDSVYINNLFKDFDFKSSDPFEAMLNRWLEYEDALPKKTNLLQYFKRLNSVASHRLTYGAYLIGDFKLDDHRGADILSMWWYNRNLRIFRKIQEITTSPNDRILVVIGNGHAAVLRQLFESSPEYKFIEFDEVR